LEMLSQEQTTSKLKAKKNLLPRNLVHPKVNKKAT
jgi:hypothetical protein